jgi:ribonuclease BN (tRNA processing enzyme)
MNHCLIINGLENAFPKELGCDCARCTSTERTANTSTSLVSLDDAGNTQHHVLFDIGGGVADSLAQHALLSGKRARLDWIVLTHWHSDHTQDIRRLCEGWRRTRERAHLPFAKIPLWCRQGSAEWLNREHPFAAQALVQTHSSGEENPAGVILPAVPLGLADVSLTPITMYHGSADVAVPQTLGDPLVRRPCCAGFALQTAHSKTLLFWDMDATNTWVFDANNAAVQLAKHADLLLIDCNTWRAETTWKGGSTNHNSFQTVCDYVKILQPKTTVLIHLSGHEDVLGDGFGWSNAEWQAHAAQAWQARNLPGNVIVPHIGQMFML